MTYSAIPSTVRSSATNRQISDSIHRLRQLSQLDVQAKWRSHVGDVSLAKATRPDIWQTWATVTPNAKNQITWDKGRQVLWLGQRLVVPHHLQGYELQGLTLRLALVWWAEAAEIFVNGRPVQAGDLFDSTTRILLSPAVEVGEVIDVAIRLESPGHDNGALVKATCLYELASQAVNPTAEPAFVADEIAVLQEFLNAFAPERLEDLAAALTKLPWAALTATDRQRFDTGLANLRQQLQPFADLVKQRQIQMVGHAHLDMAWLWPVSETWQVAEKTFQSVLDLQQEFPELTFCHTSPALYAWIEQNRPDLFTAIRAKVRTGTWDVSIAPLWIEPELNISNGESIVRQLLYGQQYLQQKFGQLGKIAWLPDTFGFNWQMPQLFKQGGVEYFVTQKLRWNDTTQFPYELHSWQSPDGSQILSLHSAPIGEGIDPVKMARYLCNWERKTGLSTALWLLGVGDHGGGPSRDMLEQVHRWQHSPFFPNLKFTTVAHYLEATGQQIGETSNAVGLNLRPENLAPSAVKLPVWNSELYLELHRGCYTNHADQKQFNRRCEDMLYEAELFTSLQTLLTGSPYPKTELEAAWKKVLFNHFHDILPGTAIASVFVDANRDWQAALDTGQNLCHQAMQAIASQVLLPPSPSPEAKLITVFNALSWARSEVVSVLVQQTQDCACFWQICDVNGQEIPSQPRCWQEDDKTYCQIFFQAEVPAVGYCCFWLMPRPTGNPVSATANAAGNSGFVLENEHLCVTLDPATGNLIRLLDKVHQRDLLSQAGNVLQAFRDSGQYWDAWDIAPDYAQFPLPPAQLLQIFYQNQGSLTTQIRVVRRLGQSTFDQVYRLDQGSAVLKIETEVDWQERHVVVKAAFPFNLNAANATYEIPCGAIQRTTQPQTPAEEAKWEVPALRWADLSDTASHDSYGVSLLSDSKHGYDVRPDQIRLTLLRGSEWPDPNADCGSHQFTYAIYPHEQDWKTAQTVRRGYELNQPLRVLVVEPKALSTSNQPTLPPTATFLNLPANLVLSAFKPAEENPHQWVLRCYECHGSNATVDWQTSLGSTLRQLLDLNTIQRTNLLEAPTLEEPGLEQPNPEQLNLELCSSINSWQITTYRFDQV